MTEGESARLQEIYRTIGGLVASVEHLTSTWQRQDEKAANGRSELYEKFEQIIATVAALGQRVENLASEVTALKNSSTTSNNRHQQDVGSRRTLAVIGTIILASTTVLTTIVVELIRDFWGKLH